MTHVRQQLRERIATNVTGLTTTGTNVFQSRVHDLATAELPCLLVFSNSESSERDSFLSSDGITRSVEVVIEGYAWATSNLDDTLDTISEEVETAVAADPTCNSLAKDTVLNGTEIELTGEGDSPLGVVRLTWLVGYRTDANTPGTAI